MLKKCTLLIIICLNIESITAQIMKKQTIGINGLSAFIHTDSNQNYFIQQSIGQMSVINTFNVSGFRLRQGFLQPISPSILNSRFDLNLDATVFPSPFTNKIKVDFIDPINDVLIVRLFNMYGQLILSKEYDFTQSIEIIVGEVATGIYNLRIDSGNKFMETKLIKK